jgi:hypothetical protein
VAVLIFAVAGASLAWFTGHHAAGLPSAAASPSRAQPSAPALTTSQATSLLTRLTSGNRAAVTSAIAMPSGQEVPPATVRGLRMLAPITAVIRSFKELSPDLATLTAVDGTGTRWLLHLVWVNGEWLVLDSVKQ